MRARLIVNPSSGTDRALALLSKMNDRLRTVARDLDVTITTVIEDAERAAVRALEERCDALYVAGGDGTLNAALRALAARAPECRMPIGVIPLGTGNDFAKALGLGEDAEPALEALLAGVVVDADLGMLNDRPFANTSAGGFIANVSEVVSEGLKDITGKLAYIIGGARALFGSEPLSAQLTINDGDDPQARRHPSTLDVQMFAVCNSRYIGGGYVIAPDAMVDDGLLDVLIVPRMPLLDFGSVLQRIASGAEPGHPGVLRFRSASFDLAFAQPARVNTDGELLRSEVCRYRVRPRSMRFFCGPAPHTSASPIVAR